MLAFQERESHKVHLFNANNEKKYQILETKQNLISFASHQLYSDFVLINTSGMNIFIDDAKVIHELDDITWFKTANQLSSEFIDIYSDKLLIAQYSD